MASTGPPTNEAQIEYWNEVAGPTWVAAQDALDALIGEFGERALARAAARPGEHVLDVGCGCGATSLALARAVGAQGSVTGVDISKPMLGRASARAREAGLTTLSFQEADAQSAELGAGRFDLVFSRFGVMFFADPTRAFGNLHRALRAPDGRLTFVCWQAATKNPWMMVPAAAAATLIPMQPMDPAAPGPFAFADEARVRDILERAGFREIGFEDAPGVLRLGQGDVASAAEFALNVGPTARALRDAGADAALRERVIAAIAQALVPYHGPDGVRLPGATWIVTARA